MVSGDYVAGFAPSVDIAGADTALVVVDLQNGLASRSAGLGRLLAQEGRAADADYRFTRIERVVVPNAARLLAAFREAQRPVVFLVVGSAEADWSDLPPHLRPLCEATGTRVGAPEYEILDEVAPRAGEPVLHKRTLSAFASTRIDDLLRADDVTTIVFAGVTTNMCVEHNVRDAADRGFQCVVVEDACATDTPEMHEASLTTLGRLYARIARTDEVIAELGAGVAHA